VKLGYQLLYLSYYVNGISAYSFEPVSKRPILAISVSDLNFNPRSFDEIVMRVEDSDVVYRGAVLKMANPNPFSVSDRTPAPPPACRPH
jgi:hypothetical protein